MRMRRVLAVLTIAILAGGSLPGCGGSKTPTDPTSQDEMDLSHVTFVDASPAAFPVTATASLVTVDREGMCWAQSRSSWQVKDRSDGNAWVFGKVNGRWYASTIDWLDPGRPNQCFAFTQQRGNAPPFQTARWPLDSWYPDSGESFGFMISSIVRGGIPPGPRGRSVVTLATWP